MTSEERARETASVRRDLSELGKRMERHLDRLPPTDPSIGELGERIDRLEEQVQQLQVDVAQALADWPVVDPKDH